MWFLGAVAYCGQDLGDVLGICLPKSLATSCTRYLFIIKPPHLGLPTDHAGRLLIGSPGFRASLPRLSLVGGTAPAVGVPASCFSGGAGPGLALGLTRFLVPALLWRVGLLARLRLGAGPYARRHRSFSPGEASPRRVTATMAQLVRPRPLPSSSLVRGRVRQMVFPAWLK